VALEPEGEPFDLILESVGGSSPGGGAQPGVAGRDRGVVRELVERGDVVRRARGSTDAAARSCAGTSCTHELLEGRIGSDGFDELVGLAGRAAGCGSDVDLVVPWTEAASAVTALLERRVRGKAVLTVGSS
jgi:hypothetical protein